MLSFAGRQAKKKPAIFSCFSLNDEIHHDQIVIKFVFYCSHTQIWFVIVLSVPKPSLKALRLLVAWKYSMSNVDAGVSIIFATALN